MSQHESTIAHSSGHPLSRGRHLRRGYHRGPRYQAGLGALGWLVVLAIASFALTCFFKIGPLYLDYWNTKGALDIVVNNGKVATMSKDELRRAVQKQLDVSLITTIAGKDVRLNEDRGVRELDASYEKRTPLIANIDVVVKFDQLKYKLPVAP
jgi:hypothetical protein